jgi:hypothetical protein
MSTAVLLGAAAALEVGEELAGEEPLPLLGGSGCLRAGR